MADDIDDDIAWLIGSDDDGNAKNEKEDKNTEVDESSAPSPDKESSEGDTSSPSPYETDEDDDGLTPAERQLLERNTFLNDADEDNYDLKDKVEKANADLEKISDLDSSRETRVMFKKKLVDVEAPPPDYSSDSSSSSDSNDESRKKKAVKIVSSDEETTQPTEDESVLVEKGGKFQLMNESNSQEQATKSASYDSAPTPQRNRANRPRSAPVSNTPRPTHSGGRRRPASASKSNEYSHIRSPYAMSPEMKELMRKRQAARAAREEEERAQEKAKQEQDRKNAEEAWKFWLEKKDQEVMERKKKEEEEAKKNQKSYDSKQEAEEAYQLWLEEKRKQSKKERIQQQQRQLEIDEGWYRRDRKECNRAYRKWLRQKQEQAMTQGSTNTKKIQRTRADVYQMRKLQRLLVSIRNSQKH